MEFLSNLKLLNQNRKPFQKWDIEQQKNEYKREKLNNEIPLSLSQCDYAQKRGEVIVDCIDKMDKESITKSEDALFVIKQSIKLFTSIPALIGLFIGYRKGGKEAGKIKAVNGLLIGSSVSGIATTIVSAYLEKMATRIARYYTREEELKDYRNFVIYSDEQIEKAKEKAKTLPDIKKQKDLSYKESFNPIKTYKKATASLNVLLNNYNNYNEWKKDYEQKKLQKEKSFENLSVSKEQIKEAEKIRNCLLNTSQRLEIAATDNESNMDLALSLGRAIFSLASVGLAISVVSLLDKFQTKHVSLQNSKAFGFIKKASAPATIFASIFAAAPAVKLIKDAAKIGRFKAKQDLLYSTNSFVTYDDEQMNKISDNEFSPKTKENVIIRVKNYFNNLSSFPKDLKAYNEYEAKRNDKVKLQEALKEIEITPKQKEDAENLQTQIFTVFEKMDDKSESFVDDSEAFIKIVSKGIKLAVNLAFNLFMINKLGDKLKLYNGGKYPDLLESLGMFKFLTKKEIINCFVIPFIIKQSITPILDIISTNIEKKACRIGVMTASKDLEDPKNFLTNNNKKN